MRQCTIVFFAALLLFPFPARAWHNRGHMAVAHIAWQKLVNDGLDQKAIQILNAHPHKEMFLLQGRPEEIDPDEWLFVRARTLAWLNDPAFNRSAFQEALRKKAFLDWADESLALARDAVYEDQDQFLPARPLPQKYRKTDLEGLEAPLLSARYTARAEKVAQQRMILAGYRLGDVLAPALQDPPKP